MMVFTFDSSGVEAIWPRFGQRAHRLGKLFRACIIEDDYSQSMSWIVEGAGGFGSVLDGVVVFTSACDEEVHPWWVIFIQKPKPASSVPSMHGEASQKMIQESRDLYDLWSTKCYWGTTTFAILTEQTDFSDEIKDRIKHDREIRAIMVSRKHASDTKCKI